MKLLLDSHTFLWFVLNNPQLSATALNLIADPGNDVYLSMASVWEISIKVGTGKLALAQPPPIFFPDQMHRNSFQLLPIKMEHAVHVATLPHHPATPSTACSSPRASPNPCPFSAPTPLSTATASAASGNALLSQ